MLQRRHISEYNYYRPLEFATSHQPPTKRPNNNKLSPEIIGTFVPRSYALVFSAHQRAASQQGEQVRDLKINGDREIDLQYTLEAIKLYYNHWSCKYLLRFASNPKGRYSLWIPCMIQIAFREYSICNLFMTMHYMLSRSSLTSDIWGMILIRLLSLSKKNSILLQPHLDDFPLSVTKSLIVFFVRNNLVDEYSCKDFQAPEESLRFFEPCKITQSWLDLPRRCGMDESAIVRDYYHKFVHELLQIMFLKFETKAHFKFDGTR